MTTPAGIDTHKPARAKAPAKAPVKAKTSTTPKTTELKALDLPVGLGRLVRDRVSGLVGIAHAKLDMVTGNIQFSIQPQSEDGSKADKGQCVDVHLLEVIGKGVTDSMPPLDRSSTILVGEEVEDIATGFKGIAVERATFVNGCVYFAVQPRVKKGDGSLPEATMVSHIRLKRIGKGIAPQVQAFVPPKATPEAPPPARRPPGGPSRSLPRMA